LFVDSYALDPARSVPEYNPIQYSYNIPFSSYSNDSSFDLIFGKVSGSNAVCSEVEVWKSTSVSSSLLESSYIFDFDIPSNYTYNSSEIIVENSSAHLINKLVYGENSSFYDFNPVTSDLSYGSYNLKSIFNLSKTYDYYNYSIELKRNGIATGMFHIAVNNISNIINVTNASTISEAYQVYTVNIPSSWITDTTPKIWTLTKPNILFRMDGTPSDNSYYRTANDNLNNTGWTLDNNNYYHVIRGYENISSSSGIIETNDLIVDNLLKWLNVSINDYNRDIYSSESNETYDYANNQTGATASATGGAEHLIDEDETINGGDYYASCNWPCNMTITFNESAYINKIYTHLWDGDARYYNYSLWLSSDGNNWTKVVDNKHAHGSQNDTFNATLTKYLKIEGLYNTVNNGFHVIEVDAFEAKQEKEIKYFYSVDSGNSWINVPLNGDISNISTTNGKIRFRTDITGSGIIDDINVSYLTFTIANCSDGIKNQDETDIDCGGSICSKCSNGKACLIYLDCQSGLCSNGICQSSEINGGNGNGGGGSSRKMTILPPAEEVIEPIIEPPITIKDFIIKSIKEISANEINKVLFDKYLESIEIITNTGASNVVFKVRELDGRPNLIPELNNTYKYLEINVENLSNDIISKAVIKFKVNKSWLIVNNFDTVALYKYVNNNWSKLKTEKLNEDNESVYYESYTPGFSYFAIRGEKIEISQEIEESMTEKPTQIKKTKNFLWIWIFSIAVLVSVITFFVLKHYNMNFFHKKTKRFSFESNTESGQYNSVCKLIGKHVFTDDGLYCGNVSEIELDLKKSRIGNIKIEIGKDSYLSEILKSKKGIMLSYKLVKAIGDIVIIKHIDKKL